MHGLKAFTFKLIGQLLLSFFITLSCYGSVLFEGYSKLMIDEKHAGYIVQRYAFDKKKKEFESTYLIVMSQGDTQESLKARAKQDFTPVGYEYTFKGNGQVKTIDASFKNGTLKKTVSNGKQKQTSSKKLPDNVFLSTFLVYNMLNKGITENKRYTYKALAEEDGEVYGGQAVVKEKQTLSGINVFRVINQFKGTAFTSFMSDDGHVISTKSPSQNIRTQLVAKPKLATSGHKIPESALKLLFGQIPAGQKNAVAKAAKNALDTKKSSTKKSSTKKEKGS